KFAEWFRSVRPGHHRPFHRPTLTQRWLAADLAVAESAALAAVFAAAPGAAASAPAFPTPGAAPGRVAVVAAPSEAIVVPAAEAVAQVVGYPPAVVALAGRASVQSGFAVAPEPAESEPAALPSAQSAPRAAERAR